MARLASVIHESGILHLSAYHLPLGIFCIGIATKHHVALQILIGIGIPGKEHRSRLSLSR